MDPESPSPPPQEPTPSPNPSPESPSPSAEEGSSTASAKPSSPGSPFIEHPGPDFDPEHAEPGPEAPAAEPEAGALYALPEVAPEWEEKAVQELLTLQGRGVHALIGVGQSDWIHTEADLVAIGGPLTRILNRYPATRAAAAFGDPILLATATGMYAIRSVEERRAVLAILAAQQEVPVTGEPAPPGSGPPEPEIDPTAVEWEK